MKVNDKRNSANYTKRFGTTLQENPGVKSGIGYFAKEFTLRL